MMTCLVCGAYSKELKSELCPTCQKRAIGKEVTFDGITTRVVRLNDDGTITLGREVKRKRAFGWQLDWNEMRLKCTMRIGFDLCQCGAKATFRLMYVGTLVCSSCRAAYLRHMPDEKFANVKDGSYKP